MLHIIKDSREQNGYNFVTHDEIMLDTGTLTTGDYTLAGFADRVAIERKELSDLLGCLTYNRERFTRELERLRGYESAAVVVESPISAIQSGFYRSKITPAQAMQSIVSIMANYRMPFYFAACRVDAEKFVVDFFRHYHRHNLQRYKALSASPKAKQ